MRRRRAMRDMGDILTDMNVVTVSTMVKKMVR